MGDTVEYYAPEHLFLVHSTPQGHPPNNLLIVIGSSSIGIALLAVRTASLLLLFTLNELAQLLKLHYSL